jgi:hypothetical protein
MDVNKLEEVYQYDPHKWNRFPEVEPPEGVWMRVEWRAGVELRRAVAHYVPWGDGDEFVWVDRGLIKNVERFRPWVGPEENVE